MRLIIALFLMLVGANASAETLNKFLDNSGGTLFTFEDDTGLVVLSSSSYTGQLSGPSVSITGNGGFGSLSVSGTSTFFSSVTVNSSALFTGRVDIEDDLVVTLGTEELVTIKGDADGIYNFVGGLVQETGFIAGESVGWAVGSLSVLEGFFGYTYTAEGGALLMYDIGSQSEVGIVAGGGDNGDIFLDTGLGPTIYMNNAAGTGGIITMTTGTGADINLQVGGGGLLEVKSSYVNITTSLKVGDLSSTDNSDVLCVHTGTGYIDQCSASEIATSGTCTCGTE